MADDLRHFQDTVRKLMERGATAQEAVAMANAQRMSGDPSNAALARVNPEAASKRSSDAVLANVATQPKGGGMGGILGALMLGSLIAGGGQAKAETTKPPASDDLHSMISETATKYGVDPKLALAMANRESSFDPNAVSHAGAQGLFQLMPGTAKDMGVKDPFDPKQNADGAMKYAKWLMNKYQDTPTMLAAWNFGPGNVDDGKPLPKETQNFQRNVLSDLGRSMPWSTPKSTPEVSPVPPQESANPGGSINELVAALSQQYAAKPQTAPPQEKPQVWDMPLIAQGADDPQVAARAERYATQGTKSAGAAATGAAALAGGISPLGWAGLGMQGAGMIADQFGPDPQEEAAKMQKQQMERERALGGLSDFANYLTARNERKRQRLMLLGGVA